MAQMSICPMCKTNYSALADMEAVVAAAEELIDIAAEDDEQEIVRAASSLKIAVAHYRNVTKETEGEDAVQ